MGWRGGRIEMLAKGVRELGTNLRSLIGPLSDMDMSSAAGARIVLAFLQGIDACKLSRDLLNLELSVYKLLKVQLLLQGICLASLGSGSRDFVK